MTTLEWQLQKALAKADALCPTGDEAMFSEEDLNEPLFDLQEENDTPS